MQERRVQFDVGVVYETKTQDLKKIPQMLEEAIKKTKNADFDRAHFSSFGDHAHTFTLVYYALTPDYNEYMDINQQILLNIREKFEKAKIAMAYPTQRLYINNQTQKQ